MYYSNMKSVDISKCILCHDAVCTKACPAMDPARIIRALRFDNAAGASMMLPKEDVCLHCDGKCQNVCPAEVPIQKLMSGLRKEFPEQKEIPGLDDVDLSCDICGVKLENPFMLSSSVVASNYEMTARAFEMGWSGAAFKTICLMDIREASPRFSTVKTGEGSFYGFKNIEQLSDYELEENLNFFRELKKNYPTKVILASIMGRNEEEWTYLAKVVTEAGADVIECNFSCPNMEAKNTGVDVGQDPETVKRYVQAVRRGTNIPILAKMTPNVADMRPAARAVTLISLFVLTISSVWVPMEPVEPRIAIFFICFNLIFVSVQLYHFHLQKDGKIVYDRRRKNDTVKPVQDPAVSGDQPAIILDIVVPLDRGRRQITDLGYRAADSPDDRIGKYF